MGIGGRLPAGLFTAPPHASAVSARLEMDAAELLVADLHSEWAAELGVGEGPVRVHCLGLNSVSIYNHVREVS